MKFSDSVSQDLAKNKVTIVINSCDAYSDVLQLFFMAFNEYWPDNNFPIIVNTETSAFLGYNEQELITKTWGERLIDTLKNINTEYVLLLFDDFILEKKVDNNKVISALNVLESDHKSSVFYLNVACLRDHEDDFSCDYRKLKDYSDYRLNSVPSLWKRKDLIRFTKPIDNPWSWEIFGSFRTFGVGKNFYSASSIENNIFYYNSSKGGAIYRGRWVREVVEDKVKKYNLNINLTERGFVDFDEKVDRSFIWKINFIFLGFRSIGFDMYKFLFRYVRSKFYNEFVK